MTDTVKSWIEERRTIHTGGRDVLLRSSYELERESGIEEGADIDAIVDAHNNLPRALDALQAVSAQIDRMEADANTYGDAGHDLACDALFAYVVTLRQAIEGAINDG